MADTSFYQRAGAAPGVDIADAATKGFSLRKLMTEAAYQPAILEQQLKSAQAAEAATRAATDTTVENLARTRYENESKRRLAVLAKAHVGKDGKIDHMGLASAAAVEGMDPATVFTYIEKANTTAQGAIKTETDKLEHAEKVLKPVYDLLRASPEGQAPGILGATQTLLSRVMGDEQSKAFLDQRLALSKIIPVNEKGEKQPPDPKVLDTYLRDIGKANATAASISPQQAVSNQQLAEQIAQGGAVGVSGPEARNPNSAVSKQAQSDYLVANPNADRQQVSRLAASDIQRLTGTSATVAASVVPGGTKAAAATAAVAGEQGALFYDKLEKAAAKLGSRYGKDFVVANIISGQIQKRIIDDPDTAEFIALVKEGAAKGIPMEPNANPATVAQIAKSQAKLMRQQAASQKKLSGQTTFNEPTVQIKRKSDGKVIPVPAADAQRFLSDPRFEKVK